MPAHPQLPELEESDPGTFGPPRQQILFSSIDGGLTAESITGIDMEAVLLLLSSSPHIQDAVGLDEQGLLRRLARHWTAEGAISDCTFRSLQSSVIAHYVLRRTAIEQNMHAIRADGSAPLLKISPALMHIENLSLASLNRPTRGVGINDLREALEGRSSISLAQRAPSISTLDHGSSIGTYDPLALTLTRSRTKKSPLKGKGAGEVRDVLNKLGIGKQNGGSLLKTPFPGVLEVRDKPR